MKDLTKVFIDLSKCTEEQRKKIAKTLSDNNQPCYQGLLNCLNNGDYNKTFYLLSFFKRRDLWDFAHEGLESTENKTKLTYPDFIKLFEGGESEGWIKIESEEDLPKDSNHVEFFVIINKVVTTRVFYNGKFVNDYQLNIEEYDDLPTQPTHYQPIIKPLPPTF